MKLTEIFNTGTQSVSTIDLTKFDLPHLRVVAPAEGNYSIAQTQALHNSNLILFAIVNNQNKILSSVAGEFHTVWGVKYFVVGGAWTDPQHTRKGLMMAIYLAIVKHLGHKILSDKEMSPEMFALWNKLHNLRGTRVLDVVNKKVLDRDAIPDAKLFQDTSMKDDYRLILESDDTGIPAIGIGILHDHQVVTHPANHGKYE